MGGARLAGWPAPPYCTLCLFGASCSWTSRHTGQQSGWGCTLPLACELPPAQPKSSTSDHPPPPSRHPLAPRHAPNQQYRRRTLCLFEKGGTGGAGAAATAAAATWGPTRLSPRVGGGMSGYVSTKDGGGDAGAVGRTGGDGGNVVDVSGMNLDGLCASVSLLVCECGQPGRGTSSKATRAWHSRPLAEPFRQLRWPPPRSRASAMDGSYSF